MATAITVSSELVSVSILAIPVLSVLLVLLLFAQQLDLFNAFAVLIMLSGIYSIYLSLSVPQQP